MLNGKKKTLALATATVMTLSVGTTTFAAPLIYDSEEGVGIEVQKPADVETYSTIEGEKVSVSGGKLWATWKDGLVFRANYDHNTKEHRCSAVNDHETVARSAWTRPGYRAISPWLDQTLFANRVLAKTR